MREDGGEETLEGLSAFDGVAVAVAMRSAIDDLLEERRTKTEGKDGEFGFRVETAVARTRARLEELGEHEMAQALQAS